MSGYWHVTYTKGDRKIQSTDHRSRRDALKFAEVEDADEIKLIIHTDRPLRSALRRARRW